MSSVLSHPESEGLWVGTATDPDYDQGVCDVDPSRLARDAMIYIPSVGRHSRVLPSLDFETYSAAGYAIDQYTGKVRGQGSQGKGGLPVVGTPAYVLHPSAEILSLYYDLKDGRGRRRWLPGTPNPTDLLDWVVNGGELEAWNVTFEWWVWNVLGVRRHGWPALPLQQCHCAMAKARRYSLPGALGKAAQVLGSTPKDPAGDALIRKLTRPHTPTKKRPAIRWTPATAWDDFQQLYRYNDQDVAAEDDASARIPDLTPDERALWLLDQTINARGVQVDTETLTGALRVLELAERQYTLELATLTGGAVGSVSQVAELGQWLSAQGCRVYNVRAETVEAALQRDDLTPAVRRVLEIRQSLGGANVKKLRTLALQVNNDGRLRDQYRYCGADRTGRFASGGVQLQNLTARGPDTYECESCGGIGGRPECTRCGAWMVRKRREWDVEAVEHAVLDVRTGDLATVERHWGDALAVLTGCLRGLLTARPGHRLLCVDFSAIEAVVLACLARCQWRIDVFSGHGKIYEASAANATGIPLEEILAHKRQHGTHHPVRKGIGKVRELAGGYGGWVNAWKAFGADDHFPDDDAIKKDVLAWREESPEIVAFWGGQYRWCGPGRWDFRPELHGLEGAAIQAIRNPGQWFDVIDVAYCVSDDVLLCRLPSGRLLHYHRPRLHPTPDKLNRGPAVAISFEGWNSNPTKGPVGWGRWETFGGRLAENCTQAVALDIQAAAMLRAEAAGYPIVMHTHDEIVAELPVGVGSVDHLAEIMVQRPAWAAWWPIRAGGWEHERYQKD